MNLWAWMGSNHRHRLYKRRALPLSYRPDISLDLTKNVEEENKKKNPKVAELVRELSRLKFAKPKEIVEQEIAKRSRLFEFLGDQLDPYAPPELPGKEGGNWGGGNV